MAGFQEGFRQNPVLLIDRKAKEVGQLANPIVLAHFIFMNHAKRQDYPNEANKEPDDD